VPANLKSSSPTPDKLQPDLGVINDLARQAGAILRASFRTGFGVHAKGRGDLVTDVDGRSEAFLIGEVQRRFPGQRIVAEEAGELAGDTRFSWYIDPLDGTLNYAHGISYFSVSLAFARDGRLELGAVYEPMRDELFSAQYGRGAWLNGERIQVSGVKDLLHSLLNTGFTDAEPHLARNLAHYGSFACLTQGVRCLGSAALELCYVAAGRLDGYWELALSSYDIAAGALIAQEAGARVTAADGSADFLRDPTSVLAANPDVHARILGVIGSKSQSGVEV
jgi:myo-inositol-1(or 4)-monophosphatase